MRLTASIDSTRLRYFEKSMSTATLQPCPARLVPPPRIDDRRAEAAAERDGRDDVLD